MPAVKPKLVMLSGAATEDVEQLVRLFQRLTGRRPTKEEIQEAAAELSKEASIEMPAAHFGQVSETPAQWRDRGEYEEDDDPDDEELAETPADVVAMLGFDPLQFNIASDEFHEEKIKRVPAGSEDGGEFAPGGGGASSTEFSSLKTMPKDIEGVVIEKRALYAPVLAMGGTNGILVNTSKRSADIWGRMESYQKKAFEDGWASTASPNHVIWHELGHVKFKRTSSIDQDSNASNMMPNSDPRFKAIAEKVSGQAAENGQEFIAEVFAAMKGGRELPGEVMYLYQQMGGPKV